MDVSVCCAMVIAGDSIDSHRYRIAGRIGDDKLTVLTISDDRKSEDLKRIVARVGTSLPVLLDKGSNTLAAYRIRILPTLYLVDQEQKVHKVWTGSIEDRETELITTITTLLKSPIPASQE